MDVPALRLSLSDFNVMISCLLDCSSVSSVALAALSAVISVSRVVFSDLITVISGQSLS